VGAELTHDVTPSRYASMNAAAASATIALP
jgi:hypothetical protein